MATATLEKIAKRKWVLHVDDERTIDNGVIIMLQEGWGFALDPDCGVRGFDTATEALQGTSRDMVVRKKMSAKPTYDATQRKERDMNAREQLEAAAHWLGWQEEALSFGLRCAEDGLKLWKWAQAHPDQPEFLDEDMVDGVNCAALRKKALGYDPLSDKEQSRAWRETAETHES